MNKTILAIDHGTKTGYSVFKGHNLVLFNNILIKSEGNRRYYDHFSNVTSLIREHSPKVMCIEQPKDMLNARTSRYLVGLYTIELLLCEMFGIEVVECHPMSVKKSVFGTANCEKLDVALKLCDYYGIELEHIAPIVHTKTGKVAHRHGEEIRDYDISDSIALGYYYNLK